MILIDGEVGVGTNKISLQMGAGAVMTMGRPVCQTKSTSGVSLNTFKGVTWHGYILLRGQGVPDRK